MSSFYIKAFNGETDLRTINAQAQFLRLRAKEYKLQDGECVIFTNRALTRFRMILRIRDAILLCIPEIDEKSKWSVYLHISEELARLAGRDAKVQLNLVHRLTSERIQRRKLRESNYKKDNPSI
jgi:hypothetical protein